MKTIISSAAFEAVRVSMNSINDRMAKADAGFHFTLSYLSNFAEENQWKSVEAWKLVVVGKANEKEVRHFEKLMNNSIARKGFDLKVRATLPTASAYTTRVLVVTDDPKAIARDATLKEAFALKQAISNWDDAAEGWSFEASAESDTFRFASEDRAEAEAALKTFVGSLMPNFPIDLICLTGRRLWTAEKGWGKKVWEFTLNLDYAF